MELALLPKGEFSKIFLAYYSEKKLSKTIVNSIDLTVSVNSWIESDKTLSLRISGQLILGILRIFSKQCAFLLSEIEDFLKSSIAIQVPKEPINAITQHITLSDTKRRVISLEDAFSTSSFLKSSRGSIEVGRNTLARDEVTLNEINYTPRSLLANSAHDLEMTENFLQDITPNGSIHELEPIPLDTPGLSVHLNTPMTQKKN